MEYIVHFGYFECDGLKFLDTREEVKDFIENETKGKTRGATFFRVYEVESVKRIALDEIIDG
jgi:hypothetical protein